MLILPIDDFSKVARMATAMVTQWGMSDAIGLIHYNDNPSEQLHKPFSEETARKIDSEVKRIVDEAYKQCKDLLVEKKAEIGLVAEELLRKEVLSRDDMIRLLGERQWPGDKSFEAYFGSRGDREGVPGSTPGSGLPGVESENEAPPPFGGTPAPTAFKELR